MNPLEALHTRNSVAKLTEPGPNAAALADILKAAVRANDHRRLRPWKFLVVEGEARNRLGQLFADVARGDNPALGEQELADIAAKTLRAPTIIIVVARIRPDANVPDVEQLLSAGGAAQLITAAAHVLGYGAIWRTGGMAYHAGVRSRLGLEEGDQIVGFLYLGTAQAVKKLADIDHRAYTEVWNG